MGKRSKRCRNRGKNISESMLLLDKPRVDPNKYTQDERETLENENDSVRKMIFEMSSIRQVCDKTFYVICFNIAGCTDEEEYIPNEVGVAKYSIRNGIEEHYHCFIDPGVIPMGYAYVFKKHSEDTHDIPVSKFELANSDYNKIFQSIVDFVNATPNKVVPVFCKEEDLEQNWGCLRWLALNARSDMKSIYLYDLTSLLMELRAYVGHSFPSRTVAVEFLNNHAFDYTPDTRCSYHEDKDNVFCALAYAKRSCLIFSDALCTFYGIVPTPNCLRFSVSDTVVQKLPESISSSSKTFTPANLHHKRTVSRNNLMSIGKSDENKDQNSDKCYAQPRMRKSHKPQLDNASCERNDASTLNFDPTPNCLQFSVSDTVVQKVPESISSSSKTFAPANLHHKRPVSRNNVMSIGKSDENKDQNSDTCYAQPRMRKSHKPQLDNASCERNDASTLNFGKPGKYAKMRQPNTIPFVLSGSFSSKSDFVNAHNDP